MKFGLKEFPKGTYRNQESDGMYIDETKSKNLDIIAESMHKDILPAIVFSGDNTSGTGKTTEMTQVACYLTLKVNEIYGLKNTFTADNVFFKVDQLLKEAPRFAKEQPYSVLCLDEPDELNENQIRKKAFELRSIFRKLRQLNLILLLTSHSFFELPKFYALNRTQALVNVHFEGKFDRGYFKFYGPKSKKLLYFRGKKEWDYDAQKSDFNGRFAPAYAFFPNCKEETEKYKKRKYRDMVDELDGKNRPQEVTEKDIIKKIFKQLHENLPEITMKQWSDGFSVTERTCYNWLKDDNEPVEQEPNPEIETLKENTNNLMLGENNTEPTAEPLRPSPVIKSEEVGT